MDYFSLLPRDVRKYLDGYIQVTPLCGILHCECKGCHCYTGINHRYPGRISVKCDHSAHTLSIKGFNEKITISYNECPEFMSCFYQFGFDKMIKLLNDMRDSYKIKDLSFRLEGRKLKIITKQTHILHLTCKCEFYIIKQKIKEMLENPCSIS